MLKVWVCTTLTTHFSRLQCQFLCPLFSLFLKKKKLSFSGSILSDFGQISAPRSWFLKKKAHSVDPIFENPSGMYAKKETRKKQEKKNECPSSSPPPFVDCLAYSTSNKSPLKRKMWFQGDISSRRPN